MRRLLTFALFLLLTSGSLIAQQAQILSSVRKIYIEKMDNGLDQYLASSISSKFHGSVSVVLDSDNADAILRGMNTAAQNVRQSNIELVDKAGKAILWSGSAGDRSMMMLDLKHGGEQKLAEKLIAQLKKAMQP